MISIQLGSLNSDDSGYAINLSSDGKLTVLQRALTIEGLVAMDKVYDGTTIATLLTEGAKLNGVIGDDRVELDFSGHAAYFVDKNAGSGIQVSVTGLKLAGAQAGNYTLIEPDGIVADITRATLTVRVRDASKVAGAENPPFSVDYLGFVGGDDVSVLSGELKLSSEATAASLPGTYPITAEGSTLQAQNYNIVYEPGELTVFAPGLQSDGVSDCSRITEQYIDGNEAVRMNDSLYCGFHAYPGEDAAIDGTGLWELD